MERIDPKTTTGGAVPVPHQEISVEPFFTKRSHLSAAPRFADAEVVSSIVLVALLLSLIVLGETQGTWSHIGNQIGSWISAIWPPAPIQYILENRYLGLHIKW